MLIRQELKSVLDQVESPHRVAPGETPDDTTLVDGDKRELKDELKDLAEELGQLQHRLYADGRYAVLLVLQGMDAAGKDSTIRHLFSATNPTGLHVTSFKRPTDEELRHDFLWRCSKALPRRGHIGIFNRSHYEDVLVVRVHPEYLRARGLHEDHLPQDFWERRMAVIRNYEENLALSGTVVLKFWLRHSPEEQRQRFLKRLNEPEKHWKFAKGDVEERQHWDDYMRCYGEAIAQTSTRAAPWFVIPADNKRYLRVAVGRIVVEALRALDLNYPQPDEQRRQMFAEMRARLGSR